MEDEKKEKQSEVIMASEYHWHLIQLQQAEYYEGFWSILLQCLSVKYAPLIFRHMKNKYAFIEITVTDLIWIISLVSILFTTIFGFISFFIIEKRFEKQYEKHHVIARYYHESRELPATEHPDYVRQINDIIPCIDYSKLIEWKLNKHFNTTTNYYYVAKRNGYEYLQEVSDEEYQKAVDDFKHRKSREEGHRLLLEYQKKRSRNIK